MGDRSIYTIKLEVIYIINLEVHFWQRAYFGGSEKIGTNTLGGNKRDIMWEQNKKEGELTIVIDSFAVQKRRSV